MNADTDDETASQPRIAFDAEYRVWAGHGLANDGNGERQRPMNRRCTPMNADTATEEIVAKRTTLKLRGTVRACADPSMPEA